jgi:hypothetical protein
MCNHNIHSNSGRVDLNCHPKWSILGSASLRNLRQKINFFYLYSTTFHWFSFHYWINSLLYVLSNQCKTLILMNIVLLLIISVRWYMYTTIHINCPLEEATKSIWPFHCFEILWKPFLVTKSKDNHQHSIMFQHQCCVRLILARFLCWNCSKNHMCCWVIFIVESYPNHNWFLTSLDWVSQ